jgi:hypothetical protein
MKCYTHKKYGLKYKKSRNFYFCTGKCREGEIKRKKKSRSTALLSHNRYISKINYTSVLTLIRLGSEEKKTYTKKRSTALLPFKRCNFKYKLYKRIKINKARFRKKNKTYTGS